MSVTISGRVKDYGTGEPVAGATLELFHLGDFDGTAIATATTDASGAYSTSVPSGTPDLLSGALAGAGIVPELHDQLRPDLGNTTTNRDFTTTTPAPLDELDPIGGRVRSAACMGLGSVIGLAR